MNFKIINRDYTLLLSSQLLSTFGNIIIGVATMWGMYERSETGDKTDLVFWFFVIPAIILAPFIGNIVDMFNRKYLIFLSDLLSGVVVICYAFLPYTRKLDVGNLYIFILIYAILASIGYLTRNSLIQNLVKQNEYLKANSINFFLQNITIVLVPMIGSILVMKFSSSVCFVIAIFSFLFAALLTLAISSYEFELSTNNSFLGNFKDGFSYIKNNKQYVNIIFWLGIIFFFKVSDTMLIKNLIHKVHIPSIYYDLYESAITVGSILIALVLFSYKSESDKSLNYKKLISGSLVLMGIAFGVFGFGHKYLLLVGALMMGFGSTLFNVSFLVYLQTYIDKNYYGRVISLTFCLITVAVLFSICFYSGLVNLLSVYLIFFLGGFMLLAIAIIFYRLSLKETV